MAQTQQCHIRTIDKPRLTELTQRLDMPHFFQIYRTMLVKYRQAQRQTMTDFHGSLIE